MFRPSFMLSLIALFLLSSIVIAEKPAEDGGLSDTDEPKELVPTYPVTEFVLQFPHPHPRIPSEGVVRPGEIQILGRSIVPQQPLFDAQAPLTWPQILLVCRTLVQHFNEAGYVGVHVGPHPEDLEAMWNEEAKQMIGGKDLREDGQTVMRLRVRMAVIGVVRSVSADDKVDPDHRVNHERDVWVSRESPLQAAQENQPANLLRKDVLDAYIYRASRHATRRIEGAVGPGDDVEAGEVTLDYLVTEVERPWRVYFQASNTGTDQTSPWRERFGFVHDQLTGRDDSLLLDYTTDFEDVHSFTASYESSMLNLSDRSDPWRYHLDLLYSTYTASDLGIDGFDLEGDEISLNLELSKNVFQSKDLFIDMVGGFRWRSVSTDDTFGTSGEGLFLIPHIGATIERLRPTRTTSARVDLEFAFSPTDEEDLEALGRTDIDATWVVLNWDASISAFLEPLLNRSAWRNVDYNNPANSSLWARLAHEVVIAFRGQIPFGMRLPPQGQGTAGGFFSVRGYPESATAGDIVVGGTAEYRFYVARSFVYQPNPQARILGRPFRVAPQQPYGDADWGITLRAFLDAARTSQFDRQTTEANETLVGAGIGAELRLLRNATLRADWATALQDVTGVAAGSNRFHLLLSLTY